VEQRGADRHTDWGGGSWGEKPLGPAGRAAQDGREHLREGTELSLRRGERLGLLGLQGGERLGLQGLQGIEPTVLRLDELRETRERWSQLRGAGRAS
jgi:hypothetical protein